MAQNSDIWIDAIDEVTGQSTTYYGGIEELWKFDYGFNIHRLVIRYQWV
jgi:hypothetical protein